MQNKGNLILIGLKPGGKTNKEELKTGSEESRYVLNGKTEVSIGEFKETLESGTFMRTPILYFLKIHQILSNKYS